MKAMPSESDPTDGHADWAAWRTDPAWQRLGEGVQPDLDTVLGLFPRLQGEPAFDPALIAANAERLETDPPIDTGHALLDRAIRTGLAHVDATFQGDRPKYGIKKYGENRHDAFPPTIIAAVDALSAWGLHERAGALLRYWLRAFVGADGRVDYYGTSVAELGQLLHTAALLLERAGPAGWWPDAVGPLDRMAGHLLELRREARAADGLLVGGPEADESKKIGRYFHNNAWASKGLLRWADVCEASGRAAAGGVDVLREAGRGIAADTLAAIRRVWPEDPDNWWLPPKVEPLERPSCLTGTRDASYTNYRYWPELLSSGLLPPNLAERLVRARLTAGGQFCGMTRLAERLDDWPLTDYLYGLWRLGRTNDFLLSLFGHVAYHQAEGHLTAYETVSFPPGRELSPYCLPCQLVAARAGRLLARD